MFGFLKSKFVAAATFFSCNALKCISINKAKVFNIMSKSNETRHIPWQFCNNTQRCKYENCRCGCKELIGKGICDTGFIWNPSSSEYECECWRKFRL